MPAIDPKPSILAPIIENTAGARHLVLDIETRKAPKEQIELSQRFWKPPSNVKDPKKLAARKKQGLAKLEEEAALLDGAPIGCIAFKTESEGAIFYWGKPKTAFTSIPKVPAKVFGFADEREMLIGIREWTDARAMATTIIVGFNIINFDLPKLRIAYLRNRLRLPLLFMPDARAVGVEVYDVMLKHCRFFSTENAGERYVKLEEVVARLGLPEYKGIVTGREVPDLLAKGHIKEVASYNWLDVASIYWVFLAQTGQYEDQKQ